MRFSFSQNDPDGPSDVDPGSRIARRSSCIAPAARRDPRSETREAIRSAAIPRCCCWVSRPISSNSAPGFGALDLRWRLPVHVVSSGTPAAFWIAMGAFFVDEFRPRWYHALAWLALLTLGATEMWSASDVHLCGTLRPVGAFCRARHLACAGGSSDRPGGRAAPASCRYAVATALYTVLIVASDWLWPGGLSAAPFSLANAVGLMGLIFLFALLGSLPSTGEPLVPAAARARQTPALRSRPAHSDVSSRARCGAAHGASQPDRPRQGLSRAGPEHRVTVTKARHSRIPAAPPDQRAARPSQFQRLHQRLSAGGSRGRAGRSCPSRCAGPDDCARRRVRLDRPVQSRLQGAYRADADGVSTRPPRRDGAERLADSE